MIEIKNLNFSYNKIQVFSNISLSFEKGNIYGLLGENGVGKTTLLKLISGLQRPNEGTCTINGIETQSRLPEILSDIYFISEDFATPVGSPLSNFNSIKPFYPKADSALFDELCKEFEIDNTRKYGKMSYGQQKKGLIATSLALKTDILLLDEPTNGLDIPSKTLFRQIISRQSTDENIIIISTHQVKDVENLIDPIIILSQDDVLLKASHRQISEKLYFETSTEQDPKALYSEPFPGGFVNVCLNTEGLESQVNIETLFNATLHHKDTIKQLLSTTNTDNHE